MFLVGVFLQHDHRALLSLLSFSSLQPAGGLLDRTGQLGYSTGPDNCYSTAQNNCYSTDRQLGCSTGQDSWVILQDSWVIVQDRQLGMVQDSCVIVQDWTTVIGQDGLVIAQDRQLGYSTGQDIWVIVQDRLVIVQYRTGQLGYSTGQGVSQQEYYSTQVVHP